MLRFFRDRELPGVERISDQHYVRGRVTATAADQTTVLAVEGEDTPELRCCLRAMFDLDSDRAVISAHLGMSNAFLPGAWSAFELAIRAVLGQQISVRAARTLAGRLIARTPWEPSAIAEADLTGLGILPSRCKTLKAVAEAAQSTDFRYEPEQLMELPGIGPCTAQYIAMRASKDSDAFPASDLILRRAAIPGQVLTERALLKYAERWQPYRAYAAISLWTSE